MMVEVLQPFQECLDNFYLMDKRYFNNKRGKCTSGFEVGCWKLQMCNNGDF